MGWISRRHLFVVCTAARARVQGKSHGKPAHSMVNIPGRSGLATYGEAAFDTSHHSWLLKAPMPCLVREVDHFCTFLERFNWSNFCRLS